MPTAKIAEGTKSRLKLAPPTSDVAGIQVWLQATNFQHLTSRVGEHWLTILELLISNSRADSTACREGTVAPGHRPILPLPLRHDLARMRSCRRRSRAGRRVTQRAPHI